MKLKDEEQWARMRCGNITWAGNEGYRNINCRLCGAVTENLKHILDCQKFEKVISISDQFFYVLGPLHTIELFRKVKSINFYCFFFDKFTYKICFSYNFFLENDRFCAKNDYWYLYFENMEVLFFNFFLKNGKLWKTTISNYLTCKRYQKCLVYFTLMMLWCWYGSFSGLLSDLKNSK